MNFLKKILVVDDEPDMREMVCKTLEDHNYPNVMAGSAKEALDVLNHNHCDIVISDIIMPGKDGIWLLHRIIESFPDIAVLMMTAVQDVEIAVSCLKGGAYDYILKPFCVDELLFSIARAFERQRLVVENRKYQQDLELKIKDKTHQLREALSTIENAYEITVISLVAALDAREKSTKNHSRRVLQYAVLLAEVMGVDMQTMESIRKGALLHDIGKIGVPDNILLKPTALTASEWDKMKTHPHIGANILRGIDFLKPALEIVLCHHERYDGSGYPKGLIGNEIPLSARIFAVVDALDAMTSNRSYRPPLPFVKAQQEIKQLNSFQFDPEVVRAFVKIDEKDWGSVVENQAVIVPCSLGTTNHV
ncbi:MAG TPA: response regulator [bacterium]|nr:response regulator [bacterium]